MKVYIASSWKNQHAVELLTEKLRAQGWEVVSWVENNYGEDHGPDTAINFEEWVRTPAADRSFTFDVCGAMHSDLAIYLGPAGTDAWAEIGAAYGAGTPIVGLWAKGEPSGLMRKMMQHWFGRFDQLLEWTENYLAENAPALAT